jgi:NADH pyrophosphatase NudC (nudix superfamily)
VGSQAWGFSGPDVLLLVFTGRAVDPDGVPVVDGHELARAHWFPLTDLPPNLPLAPSIARTVIDSLRA